MIPYSLAARPSVFSAKKGSQYIEDSYPILKFLALFLLSMEEGKEGEELRKEPAKDYYAGYYWGSNPYTSADSLSGRKSDGELINDIIEKLKKNSKINSSEIQISVTDSVAALNGSVATYEERRLVAEEVWNVAGVVKVLNELRVTDPETAGPSRTVH